MGNLIEKLVKDLPEPWKKNIPEIHYEKTIVILEKNSRKNATRIIYDYLNERFVRRQLNLRNPDSDNRDTWYLIEERLKTLGGNDLSGSNDQQYISILHTIDNYCEELKDFFRCEYWGFVLEELNIKSKARAIVYGMDMKGILLDITSLEGSLETQPEPFTKAPFFFLVCEKEAVLLNVMNGLKDLGYNVGWYGICTQGYATTNVIKLLLKFKEAKKFYIFVLHDYDLDGLTIFFDMKRYFNCESAGLNPELMNRVGLRLLSADNYDNTSKNSLLLQDYKSPDGKARPKQTKGALSVLDSLKLSFEETKLYTDWINGCTEGRAELQALTGHRLNEDMNLNPARDFVDYIEHLLENFDRKYDLNRYREPNSFETFLEPIELRRPNIIDDTIEELQNKISEVIETFLESKNLNQDVHWKALVSDQYDKMRKGFNVIKRLQRKVMRIRQRRLVRANKRYDESLIDVRSYLQDQDSELYHIYRRQEETLERMKARQVNIIKRIFSRKEEFKDIKEVLDTLREDIMKTLDEIEIE